MRRPLCLNSSQLLQQAFTPTAALTLGLSGILSEKSRWLRQTAKPAMDGSLDTDQKFRNFEIKLGIESLKMNAPSLHSSGSESVMVSVKSHGGRKSLSVVLALAIRFVLGFPSG